VENEHARDLVDVLFRRTQLGWNASIPPDALRRAAEEIARPLGWNAERIEAEIEKYEAYVARYHLGDGRTEWRS
jgi:glycerol-3-phosphate dehydrogenase